MVSGGGSRCRGGMVEDRGNGPRREVWSGRRYSVDSRHSPPAVGTVRVGLFATARDSKLSCGGVAGMRMRFDDDVIIILLLCIGLSSKTRSSTDGAPYAGRENWILEPTYLLTDKARKLTKEVFFFFF